MRTGFHDRARTRPRKGERGSVLVMAVVLLGALMVLTASFLRLGVNLSHEHNSDVDDSRAFCIAEAGVAEASAAILSGRSGNVGSQAVPARFANGIVWVVATDLGGSDFQLDSTALCDSGRAAVRAVVHQEFNVEYTQGVTSDLPLIVGSNFMIDSYDPAKGSYASQPKQKLPGHNDLIVGTKGNIKSNGDIRLSTNDRIYGDANPGPGSTVSGIGGNTFVTGTTTPANRKTAFPAVVVPVLPSLGTKTVKKSDTLFARTLSAGNYHFSSVTIGNQASLTVQGPATVVIDSLTTNSGCNLNIDATGGPVNVYFTGPTNFVSNMTVTSTAPSAKSISLFFASDDPVALNPNATLLGTIYAPTATVTVSSNWANFGAITAKAVVLSSNSRLHFDESLLTQGRQGAATLALREWQRLPVPASMIHSRVDPYKLLGVARGSLQNSSDAYH
jgi:hypothetical protein